MNPEDPVEQFFRDERAAVRPLPTDEAHWTSLVAATRTRSSHRVGLLSAAAAAVVVVGGLGWALHPGPPDTTQTLPANQTTRTVPTASSTPTPSSTTSTRTAQPSPSSTPTTSPSTSTSPTPSTLAVPGNFTVVSMSNVGKGVIFALGRTTCGTADTACPALARTTDDGRTWRLVSSFPKNTPPTGPANRVGTDDSLSQVRFASADVGWVYGGALKMTTDGGRTWTDAKHSGKAVIDLETDGKTVVASTSEGSCDGSSCTGDVGVDVSPVTGWKPSTPQGSVGGGEVTAADVTFHDGTAFVSPLTEQGSDGPVRVGTALSPVASTCEGEVAGPVSILAPAADGTVFAVCPAGGAAGSVGYHLAASTDDGATWTPVSTDTLTLADSGSTSYAATDDTHLLAVSGGSPDLKGSMKVSADGGRTWHEPAAPPPTPDRGWAWVGAPGGRTLYAVPAGGAAGFWVSNDDGEHWSQLRVAGR